MSWDTFEIGKDLIGDPVSSGEGYYEREQQFITLPENQVYDAGYGFYMSSRLVGEEAIRLPDDYKVELQMSPTLRDPSRRYKRFRLTGREIKDLVFLPHQQKQAEAERARELARRKRNKKVMGKIVYGQYTGNTYGDFEDLFEDCFFYNGNRYSNESHEKVANVKVNFVVMDDVSKAFFEDMADEIKDRLRPYVCIQECIARLRSIENADERTLSIIAVLERENEQILAELVCEWRRRADAEK